MYYFLRVASYVGGKYSCSGVLRETTCVSASWLRLTHCSSRRPSSISSLGMAGRNLRQRKKNGPVPTPDPTPPHETQVDGATTLLTWIMYGVAVIILACLVYRASVFSANPTCLMPQTLLAACHLPKPAAVFVPKTPAGRPSRRCTDVYSGRRKARCHHGGV